MSLTIDPTINDINEWAADQSMVDDWLYVLWGITPGASSRPARRFGRLHPSSVTAGDWLSTVYGFAV